MRIYNRCPATNSAVDKTLKWDPKMSGGSSTGGNRP